MLMLKALRQYEIRRLWLGQALSSVGDEIYRVGLTWMAVGLIGADTGYLTAAQAAALMILSVVGGKWADRWDPLLTMVRVDWLRAFIVLLPVVYSFFAPVPLALLVIVAIALSSFSAFFDPALQTILPKFSPSLEILQATNGLMMTTIRLARMVGPGIVGLLAGILPPLHFFTLDSLTFLFSAASLSSLQDRKINRQPSPLIKISFTDAIFSGFRALRGRFGMSFIMASKALTNGTWNLAFGLGYALLVQKIAPGDSRSFGLVMAAYGMGNFAGALYFGNQRRPRPALMMFIGYIWLGLGFVMSGFCNTIPTLMVAVAITGFSGTMNEVTFFDLVQTRFPLNEITRIFRLRVATDTAATLVFMLLAPFLFRMLGVRWVIVFCGIVWIGTGTAGMVWFRSLYNNTKLTTPTTVSSLP